MYSSVLVAGSDLKTRGSVLRMWKHSSLRHQIQTGPDACSVYYLVRREDPSSGD
jgi:hypothetical protein